MDLDNLLAFAGAIKGESVGLKNDNGDIITLSVDDLLELHAKVEELEQLTSEFQLFRDSTEEVTTYEAAVTADLGEYIAELQSAGKEVDSRLLAIINQQESEHDPGLLDVVVGALEMLGVVAPDKIMASALLDVISVYVEDHSEPQETVEAEPQQLLIQESSPGPPEEKPARVLRPVPSPPPTFQELPPERVLPGVTRDARGRIDSGAL